MRKSNIIEKIKFTYLFYNKFIFYVSKRILVITTYTSMYFHKNNDFILSNENIITWSIYNMSVLRIFSN